MPKMRTELTMNIPREIYQLNFRLTPVYGLRNFYLHVKKMNKVNLRFSVNSQLLVEVEIK